MTTKAERTSQYIIETVAPIFNKHGYVGTSLSHLTEATGLTKGAIYGNFENKESLALISFQHLRTILLDKIDEKLGVEGDSKVRIFNLINFYREYDQFIEPLGGCPILNFGVDSQGNNDKLAAACKETVKEIEGKIAFVLENGVNFGEIRLPVAPLQFAKQLFTFLNGAIAMNDITGDRKYLLNTIAYLEQLIGQEFSQH
ncbi:TetR/AcrR family transcriptional regulator [Croceivirga thetidis]|uniref:TetR/AcrR family transcriptional regulator n=1 Tax=Croceivirga thetidis TaxID=2721623 RepID=A0ABX1GSC5_9FLAO|nr:TetR/AcrR family transcriptional regulator [Croceivirga thetidis]NKI32538.1 TetR/AcrR family transcriptional regulator [Croceivirga thetidis]